MFPLIGHEAKCFREKLACEYDPELIGTKLPRNVYSPSDRIVGLCL